MIPPTISFIVPVRDDAHRLRRCLRSIARNNFPAGSVQVIVVDNESCDESADVARQAGALVLTMPGSVAELRNRGARAAAADLLAFVDADHEIDASWIQRAVDALAAPTIAAAGAPYSLPADANWLQRRYHMLRPRITSPQPADWLGSGNLVVRRDVFARLNGFDTSLQTCEDVDLCNRIRRAGRRVVADPKLRSVHHGDPSTLAALFLGELWRGRDNLRVTLRGPRNIRNFRSALIAIADLGAMTIGSVALAGGFWRAAIVCAAVPAGLAAVKAAAMARREDRFTIVGWIQSHLVALTYDVARALALVAGGSHAARRYAERTLDVATD